MKQTSKTTPRASQRNVTVEGLMSFGKLDNGLHTADFACGEDAALEPFCSTCKVQAMRDGNVYVTELPHRVKNHPLFRDDNCSLTLGRNGRYYFVFTMSEDDVDELPAQLLRQAGAIARKVLDELVCNLRA